MSDGKLSNWELMESLELVITLKDHEWDGEFNITQIIIYGKEKTFLLDTFVIHDTNTDLNGDPVCIITTRFETLEETIKYFEEDGHDFEQSLDDLIRSGASAKTNLSFLNCRDQAIIDANKANIERVISIKVESVDKTYSLPVEHDPALRV